MYEMMLEMCTASKPAAVATIVRTRGSTPREVGARMVVDPDGRISGTIGGGCGEAEVWSVAMEILKGAPPRMVEVDLLHDEDTEGGRACGGVLYVFVELLSPAPNEHGNDSEQHASLHADPGDARQSAQLS